MAQTARYQFGAQFVPEATLLTILRALVNIAIATLAINIMVFHRQCLLAQEKGLAFLFSNVCHLGCAYAIQML